MFGLFVKRHAQAVKKWANVGVIFALGQDNSNVPTYKTDFTEEDGLPTTRVYFRKNKTPLLGTFINGWRYLSATRKGYKILTEKIGKPQINHVNTLTRAGVFPLWLKLSQNIPYIITEHWTRYLPVNSNAYSGTLRKRMTELVVKYASAVTPVSLRLANAMQKHGLKNSNYILANNVVDTNGFVPGKGNEKCLKWVHVSCIDEHHKNITGLISGFVAAYANNPDLRLTIIGTGVDFDTSVAFAQSLRLPEGIITFTGMLQGAELHKELPKHDAFVMFSRYENQPVVIIEAFACGMPVVATDVGGIPQMLENNRGILIPSEDKTALTSAIEQMANGNFKFSREEIRNHAVENFSQEAVGRWFYNLYSRILNGDLQ